MFGDVPNRWTIAGAAIVIASGLYLLHRERVRGPLTAVADSRSSPHFVSLLPLPD